MGETIIKNSPTTEHSLITCKNISQSFDYELFNNINIEIFKQQSISIIGTSGSGKSTFLNILSSLLKPMEGQIVFNNKDLYSLSQKKLLEVRRNDFGIIFQAHYLFRGFTALENLSIAHLLSDEEIDMELLKELNIDHIINQGVGELSGGQQQRLSIARVLTKKPKIIFADEPTGNLDKDTAKIVMDTLFKYIKNNNAALVLVTHENDLAFSCDKVYKLEQLQLQELK